MRGKMKTSPKYEGGHIPSAHAQIIYWRRAVSSRTVCILLLSRKISFERLTLASYRIYLKIDIDIEDTST